MTLPDGVAVQGLRIAPFMPLYSRATTPQDQSYPDAWRLPGLPPPLLMLVAKTMRQMNFAKRAARPPIKFSISGITKDSTGTPLGSCVVDLFTTPDDVIRDTTTSNASGEYTLSGNVTPSTNQYAVAYKAGSPDVAGTTVNTLRGQ